MPEKDPQNWSLASLLVCLGFSAGGGLVSYLQEVKTFRRFDLLGFLVDMLTSTFVGVLAFWICHDCLNQPQAMCAGAAGFAGNLGANVFMFLKVALRKRLGVTKEDLKNE